MKKVLKANIYILIIIILEIILPFILAPMYAIMGISDIKIMLFLNHVIIFLIPAAIYFLVTKESPKKVLRLNGLKVKDLFLVILIGFLAYPVMMFFSLLSNIFFKNNVQALFSTIMESPYIILLLLIAVLPAITEEVTIRGIVLSGYDFKNKYLAALMTGIFFGILHLDMQQFFYAVALGMILALLVRATNSIFSGCIVHFILNGTSLTLQKIMLKFSPAMVEEGSQMSIADLPPYMLIMQLIIFGLLAIGFAAIIGVIINYLEKRNTNINIENDMGVSIERTERVVNLPFIILIIIFIVYMFCFN